MIDLVCVNLYEFEKTVADPSQLLKTQLSISISVDLQMSASSCKNNDFVTVVVDPASS